jgi:hypothetical protein
LALKPILFIFLSEQEFNLMAELASQPTSIQTMYTWYRESKLFVNRRYQRKLVWTQTEKQKLIGSILNRYPIPAILIAERDGFPGTYEIIDGLQRLHSIVSFIENAFPIESGRFFDAEAFPTAKVAASEGAFDQVKENLLSSKEVSLILDYTLAVSVMRNATETEINDVFDRINTYGHRLSDQERRQAGVQNDFSSTVRKLACTLRGDSSADILPLGSMPSISIDLPKANHGYEVRAEEVFWVKQGILRSTDLRDSLDEQCLADLLACIVGGQVIERSKDALDEIYSKGTAESDRILTALEVYGAEKACDEIKFCIDEILKVCATEPQGKLRGLIFSRKTTNAFPSVFAVVLLAFYELIVKDGKKISNYYEVKNGMNNLADRIETNRKATSEDERRKNIDTIKGLIGSYFIPASDLSAQIYGNHTAVDIESLVRRSEIEVANYELKQGLLYIKDEGGEDGGVIDKVIKTICAIANNGPKSSGKILIGATDKQADANKIAQIDGISPRKIGKRWVVGVNREAKRLNISTEAYFTKWKNAIKNTDLSAKLRDNVLSNMDFNSFYGLGVIVISIPPQKELSFVRDEVYWRSGSSTELADTHKQVAMIASRF